MSLLIIAFILYGLCVFTLTRWLLDELAYIHNRWGIRNFFYAKFRKVTAYILRLFKTR